MLMLTRQQLNDLLDSIGYSNKNPIPDSYIRLLYKTYGDEYYKDPGVSSFELCIENPYWNDKRGQPGYPRQGSQESLC